MEAAMFDAFISYSRDDLKTVQILTRRLDERHLKVFVDLDSLRAGNDWPPQLGRAIQQSRMMVLCWSVYGADSEWVQAEIKHSMIAGKQVLPWLLDNTPLPPMLQQKHGIPGEDPDPLIKTIVEERKRHHRRTAVRLGASAVVVVPALWFSFRVSTPQRLEFRGHVIDGSGSAVAGAIIEAEGVRAGTDTRGEFVLVLHGAPSRRALRVTLTKPGYRSRTIETQSDVPDFGIILEKDR